MCRWKIYKPHQEEINMLWQDICKKIEKSFLNIYLCLFVTSLFVNKLPWKICVSFLKHSKRKLLQTLNTNSYLSPESYGFDQFLCSKLLYKMGQDFFNRIQCKALIINTTICTRSFNRYYKSNYIKWVKTSWTYNSSLQLYSM